MENERFIQQEQSSGPVRNRREVLITAGLSGLVLSAGVLGLTRMGAAEPPSDEVQDRAVPLFGAPLHKSREAAVLMRGPDGALYLVPQSGLNPYRVPPTSTKAIVTSIPELQKPLSKLSGSLAVRLGLVKADDVPTVYKAF
jgi:hypothetical protein